MVDDNTQASSEIGKSIKVNLNFKSKTTKDPSGKVEITNLSNLSPRFKKNTADFISHNLTKNTNKNWPADNEYFKTEDGSRVNYQNLECKPPHLHFILNGV